MAHVRQATLASVQQQLQGNLYLIYTVGIAQRSRSDKGSLACMATPSSHYFVAVNSLLDSGRDVVDQHKI